MDLSWAHIHERKAKIANDLFTFSTTVEMVSESGVDVRIYEMVKETTPNVSIERATDARKMER